MTTLCQLHTSRLVVEVAEPGTVYHGPRFDWFGIVTQVTLEGQHTFCVPESYRPNHGSGGIGLCGEFGNDLPVGFAETRPGALFPKLGIGLLKREDETDYHFFRPYPVEQPFPWRATTSPTQVSFTVDPLDCNGYAVRLEKTLALEDNTLTLSYRLDNVGSRPIATNEYAHNFVGVNRQPVGPEYRLRLWGEAISPDVVFEGEQITWRAISGDRQFYFRRDSYLGTSGHHWELIYDPGAGQPRVGLREHDDFCPARVAVWGTAHTICPEVFIAIKLEPGQSQSWSRRFEFFAAEAG